ncbi:hypothetical protein [Shewanella sp.]|uniref:hypothetical protein n=1 Tax=Shewanella sp. TaxID=50422 RepID=UPI003D13626E
MNIETKFALPVAKTVFSVLKSAYQTRQQSRVEVFLKSIDLCYETMTTESQAKLKKYIESETGQDILAKYADTVLQTSSRRAHMALALLYCGDPDFLLEGMDLNIFVGAMVGISDDQIDFFQMAVKVKCQEESLPFPRAAIHNQNCDSFVDKGWDAESIFVYVHDLIRRRLLLPDSDNYQSQCSSGEGWAVWFGITNKSRKMSNLIEKASALLEGQI